MYCEKLLQWLHHFYCWPCTIFSIKKWYQIPNMYIHVWDNSPKHHQQIMKILLLDGMLRMRATLFQIIIFFWFISFLAGFNVTYWFTTWKIAPHWRQLSAIHRHKQTRTSTGFSTMEPSTTIKTSGFFSYCVRATHIKFCNKM